MKTFTDGSQRDYNRLNRIMRASHLELVNAEARVSLTYVRAFDKDENPEPSLKFAGRSAHAMARLISAERKLRIPFDAEIRLDGYLWDELDERAKDALIDHELCHITVKTDAHGQPLIDDQQHVKLKLVPDDIVLTGFLSVIRRYGENALEYRSITHAMESAAQALAAGLHGEITEPEPQDVVAVAN